MGYSITEGQLVDAGFAPVMPQLPLILRSYEKTLPNGNILHIAQPHKDKAQQFGAEFIGRKPVRNYWIRNDAEFAAFAAAIGGAAGITRPN